MQEHDDKVHDRLGDEIGHESQPLRKEEEEEAAIKLHVRA